MNIINSNMKWIMLIAGILTFSMIFAAIAPQQALSTMYGENLNGPLAEVIVRNWGVLIALIGGMLIYGAFNLDSRKLVLVVASLSKIAFITLVIINGFGQKLMPAISFDTALIIIFSLYLFSNQGRIK